MEEKCVCHINGYKVVDPEAKKHMENKENPHGVTAEQIGAKPKDWMPTAEDVGAAPSGFGLGTTNPQVVDDLNKCLASGWYFTSEETLNLPHQYFRYASVHVSARISSQTVQRLVSVSYRCEMLRYSEDGGNTWIEEWIQPPMFPGVEYRTTERFNGKPVYAKMINSAASASTTSTAVLDIPHGIENFGNVVRCTARIGACVLPIIEQTGNISVYWVNATNVRMKLNNYSHTKQMGIDIRYVKA